MKTRHLFKAKLMLLLGALALLCLPISAQQNKHYLKGYLGVGYGQLFHGIEDSKVPGGVEFGGGVGYEFNMNRLLLSVGAEFMYLNSKTKLVDYVEHRDYLYQSRPQGSSTNTEVVTMEYHYNFPKYEEKHQVGYLNIPIQVGMTFAERYYAMIGAKIGINMIGKYDLSSTIRTTATDVTLMGELEDIYTHHLTTTDFPSSGDLSLGLNIAPTLEFGVILDEWINPRFKQAGNRPVSYRAAIVADYSVVNINDFSTNRGLFTEPGNNPLDINMNGLLSSSLARDKNVGNFYIGAKFTVLFQMNQEKKPKEKRTPPKREPRERPPRVTPPTFNGRIVDAETGEDMKLELIIIQQPEGRQVFKGAPNQRTGLVSRRLSAGTYDLSVVAPEGYLNYLETIELTATDTIIIALEQIKKEEPIILHNLLFELNSAVIDPSSETELSNLYQLLTKNPEMRIEIIGHTDNTGQRAYNQNLSQARAKAVYDDLIRRGVEPERLRYSGKADTQPIDTNETEEGRANNRRVEFIIL